MKTLVRHRQTTAPQALGMLRLPVSDTLRTGGVLSPYFRCPRSQKVGTGRVEITLNIMANIKVLVGGWLNYMSEGNSNIADIAVSYVDKATGLVVLQTVETIPVSKMTNVSGLRNYVSELIDATAAANDFTIQPADIIWTIL